jgi:hypothetical protein
MGSREEATEALGLKPDKAYAWKRRRKRAGRSKTDTTAPWTGTTACALKRYYQPLLPITLKSLTVYHRGLSGTVLEVDR